MRILLNSKPLYLSFFLFSFSRCYCRCRIMYTPCYLWKKWKLQLLALLRCFLTSVSMRRLPLPIKWVITGHKRKITLTTLRCWPNIADDTGNLTWIPPDLKETNVSIVVPTRYENYRILLSQFFMECFSVRVNFRSFHMLLWFYVKSILAMKK